MSGTPRPGSTGLRQPLPITGFSLCTPIGVTQRAALEALQQGQSGLRPPPLPLPFTTVAGVVEAELPEVPAELQRWAGRPASMAVHLVQQLEGPLSRARERWPAHRIGVVLGTSTAGARATEIAYQHFVQTGVLPRGYDFHRQHGYGAIVDVVKALAHVSGPGWVVSTTCTSSAKTFGSAMRMIDAGLVDAVIVGGFDTLCAVTLAGFHSLDALSSEACRPFSDERAGINIGEGGALVLIERRGEAEALLEGVGESSDAYHISAPHPKGEGAEQAMREALAQAGVNPEQVDCMNAHGTGTRLNDIAESQAIERVFGTGLPVASTKGYTGHTLGGAGATEAALSLLTLRSQYMPKSLGAEPVDARIVIDVCREGRSGSFRRIMSNSFAFGGNNVCLLLRSA